VVIDPDVRTDFPGVPLVRKPFTAAEIDQALIAMLCARWGVITFSSIGDEEFALAA